MFAAAWRSPRRVGKLAKVGPGRFGWFDGGVSAREVSVGIGEDLAREIVRRVLSVVQPRKIILFGSAASGTMTPDSDVDLLVVEDEPRDVRAESANVLDRLRGLGHPFDVIVIPTARFEETKGVIGGIAYPAHKYGKILYEAA